MQSKTRKAVVSVMKAGRENMYRVAKKETHDSCSMVNLVSVMLTLFCLACRTSVSFGRYPGEPIRRTSPKKLQKGSAPSKPEQPYRTHYVAESSMIL